MRGEYTVIEERWRQESQRGGKMQSSGSPGHGGGEKGSVPGNIAKKINGIC